VALGKFTTRKCRRPCTGTCTRSDPKLFASNANVYPTWRARPTVVADSFASRRRCFSARTCRPDIAATDRRRDVLPSLLLLLLFAGRVYLEAHVCGRYLSRNFSLSRWLFDRPPNSGDVADLHKTHRWKFVNVINAGTPGEFARVHVRATPPCRVPELLILSDRDETFRRSSKYQRSLGPVGRRRWPARTGARENTSTRTDDTVARTSTAFATASLSIRAIMRQSRAPPNYDESMLFAHTDEHFRLPTWRRRCCCFLFVISSANVFSSRRNERSSGRSVSIRYSIFPATSGSVRENAKRNTSLSIHVRRNFEYSTTDVRTCRVQIANNNKSPF